MPGQTLETYDTLASGHADLHYGAVVEILAHEMLAVLCRIIENLILRNSSLNPAAHLLAGNVLNLPCQQRLALKAQGLVHHPVGAVEHLGEFRLVFFRDLDGSRTSCLCHNHLFIMLNLMPSLAISPNFRIFGAPFNREHGAKVTLIFDTTKYFGIYF